MPPLRAVLLGSGNSARTFHGPFILALPDQWQLRGVFERGATPERSRARETFGPSIKVYTGLEEVLSDVEVDVTIVCAATPAHFAYAKASILAGKHVIVEKPFTTTAAEAKELAILASERNVIIMPYQNRRFDGDFLTIRRLLSDGTIPAVIDFESRYDCNVTWNLGDPGVGKGVVVSLGSHVFDQTVQLFGPPASVYADCWNGRGTGHPEAIDSCNMMLSTQEKQLRFLIRGKDVSYIKHGMDPQEEQTMAGMGVTDPAFGEEDPSLWGTLARVTEPDKQRPSPYLPATSHRVRTERGRYLAFYANAAKAIMGEEAPCVTVHEAIVTLSIIEAAKRSSEEKRVVDLDL